MLTSSQKIIVGFLFLVAIFVGALVLVKSNSKTQSSNNTPITPTPPPATMTYKKPVPSKISLETLQKYIAASGTDSTAEQKKQTAQNIGQASVISSVLDITGCVATPNLIRVKMNESFYLTNKDDKPHQIYYGQKSITVAPASEKSVTLTFPSPGNYAYRCDNSKSFEGMFLVTP